MNDAKTQLEAIRKRIDEIDEELIKLMAERTNFAKDIAMLKKALNMPINDSKREKEVYEKTRKLCNKYNFDEEIGVKIIKILVEHNKAIQSKYLKK
ncbi:chorismate mutase [Methanotorris igneus]|uniref:Chorismate mutase, type II n=1 Tax=Methanotorris igneus (strain DSM 5666 / JCM 11834 / Kol 5) TaxID=880724 RepID=F6BER1_METIK|nr:chorismate mutase [Methanotorris igneus]AEF96858.1 Chorismate mutase, type II [Methanotorris igneus Kol 5]